MGLERYIYDPLYGRVTFPEYVWKTLLCPELQRLREVRLCNINSLCLTGGANVNRYEHSLGTAFLALRCLEAWPARPDEKTQRRIVLSALLHDVGSPAFGHSVQYVLDLQGYKHESLYDIVNPSRHLKAEEYSYQHARLEPIYFGMPRRLRDLIDDGELRLISQIVAGHGPFGPLLNGSIDLDNIDNVYRLAYHIGLVNSGEIPLGLACSIRSDRGKLVVEESSCPMLQDWYEVRRILYRYLLLNPDEFSAKCMLGEALELAQIRSDVSFNWYDVDFQLLEKLSNTSDEVSVIVTRLMLGDLYGCVGIYATSQIDAYEMLVNPRTRGRWEAELSKQIRELEVGSLKNAIVALHGIKDMNKTQRQINAVTSSGRQVEIGVPSKQVLVGAFLKNKHLGMTTIKEENLEKWGVRPIVVEFLREALTDPAVEELTPYAEAADRTK